MANMEIIIAEPANNAIVHAHHAKGLLNLIAYRALPQVIIYCSVIVEVNVFHNVLLDILV